MFSMLNELKFYSNKILFIFLHLTDEIRFYKYHGTGNDFVVIDDRMHQFDITNEDKIRNICNREKGRCRWLMLLRNHLDADFEMLYFNANGKREVCVVTEVDV